VHKELFIQTDTIHEQEIPVPADKFLVDEYVYKGGRFDRVLGKVIGGKLLKHALIRILLNPDQGEKGVSGPDGSNFLFVERQLPGYRRENGTIWLPNMHGDNDPNSIDFTVQVKNVELPQGTTAKPTPKPASKPAPKPTPTPTSAEETGNCTNVNVLAIASGGVIGFTANYGPTVKQPEYIVVPGEGQNPIVRKMDLATRPPGVPVVANVLTKGKDGNLTKPNGDYYGIPVTYSATGHHLVEIYIKDAANDQLLAQCEAVIDLGAQPTAPTPPATPDKPAPVIPIPPVIPTPKIPGGDIPPSM
jgi:hypothetical protein